MIIEPVESIPDLFLVRDVYDSELLEQFLSEDRVNWNRVKLPMQEDYDRDTVERFDKSSVWNQMIASVDRYKLLDIKLQFGRSVCWMDNPGFCMGTHRDNRHVWAAMQVYLTDGDPGYGTHFYDHPGATPFVVPYKKNCGYVMINQKQLHGVPVTVKTFRMSTYTWLTPKS